MKSEITGKPTVICGMIRAVTMYSFPAFRMALAYLLWRNSQSTLILDSVFKEWKFSDKTTFPFFFFLSLSIKTESAAY